MRILHARKSNLLHKSTQLASDSKEPDRAFASLATHKNIIPTLACASASRVVPQLKAQTCVSKSKDGRVFKLWFSATQIICRQFVTQDRRAGCCVKIHNTISKCYSLTVHENNHKSLSFQPNFTILKWWITLMHVVVDIWYIYDHEIHPAHTSSTALCTHSNTYSYLAIKQRVLTDSHDSLMCCENLAMHNAYDSWHDDPSTIMHKALACWILTRFGMSRIFLRNR